MGKHLVKVPCDLAQGGRAVRDSARLQAELARFISPRARPATVGQFWLQPYLLRAKPAGCTANRANTTMVWGSSPVVSPGPFAWPNASTPHPLFSLGVWAGLPPSTTPFFNTTQYDRQYRHLSVLLQ